MRIDDLNELPEWDDDKFRDEDDEGEEWRPNPTRDLCKAMYQQWNQIMIVLNAAFDSLKDPVEDGMFSKEHLENLERYIQKHQPSSLPEQYEDEFWNIT